MAAALWVLAVRWEEMEEEKRPKTKEALRKVGYGSFSLKTSLYSRSCEYLVHGPLLA